MRFLGCKTLLLDDIKELIDRKAPDAHTFCDIFSGTATVSRYFKQYYEVTSNDLMYFSYILQKATIENDRRSDFLKLKGVGIEEPVKYFNGLSLVEMENLSQSKRFFQNTYAPTGGRMYVNDDNALRIDFARNAVEDWRVNGLITDMEYSYLIACIVEGIPFVSNISGTYGAFHKTWDKRSYKTFALIDLPVLSNGKNNRCFNEDGIELLKRISGDILYVDPPYNERQYPTNYHVLETAAKYDFPKVKGVTAQRDCDASKSDFCNKNKALGAFEMLMKNAQYRHIILSYSTDGLMALEDIECVMKSYGLPETFEINRIPYRRYKSKQKSNLTEGLSELLIYIEKES